MLDNRIEFEDRYDSEEYGTTTLYFIAPKEMLNGKYPEAEHAEISVEMPTNHMEARYASVRLSPTKYFEEDCCYTDYDWFDVNMSYEEIEELIALAGGDLIMRANLVEDFLDNLNFPYDDYCVNYIVRNWEKDHEEELKEYDGFEIDEEDVKIYWFDYVKEMLFV